MRKIVLTGGGSTGHVSLNLALIPLLREKGWRIHYIGSKEGIERSLIEKIPDVTYHSISTGKLRRYFDLKNFLDPLKVGLGVLQAQRLIRKIKPDIVFSKGGFVSVPVVMAAWMNRVSVISHESDYNLGLASKLAIPFSKRMAFTFPETRKHIPKEKALFLGPVVRPDIHDGEREKGLRLCGFDSTKSVILVMGGSLGAKKINGTVRRCLPALLENYHVVHLCGKGKADAGIAEKGYKQFEYVDEGLADLYAAADLIISRAGSNSIFEFLALRIPMILIPLPLSASRGDQILNAKSFAKQGFGEVLNEEEMTEESLIKTLREMDSNREAYIKNMESKNQGDGLQKLYHAIASASIKRRKM
ncbi:undecaprenyldiphospho-muramoylpentapeptide beta-N-acetylglucosaminyltransferase [Bacillus massilinigeriensis]|uniref:undecaprenyldiphospho-muramoylpentapeptide beta-N-acetylglucosaminyltransferase n=1 Tax=Bacillus mediterraneensis TaxID=1805474 RepID=UPI0008F8B9AD|nr:undecaprenyldiphospho-muramoylpentapeptide beta-N-acetylglucosaminyltransferase [Bacillus mediterraneensis]